MSTNICHEKWVRMPLHFPFVILMFLFDSHLQGILTRKDIIRLMHEANTSEKFEH